MKEFYLLYDIKDMYCYRFNRVVCYKFIDNYGMIMLRGPDGGKFYERRGIKLRIKRCL